MSSIMDGTTLPERLLPQIRELIAASRQAAARAVNFLQVATNFEIGRVIVEHEQQGARRAGYGQALISRLSAALTAEFGKGYSSSNLEYMRRFYIVYSDRDVETGQTVSGHFAGAEKSQTSSGESLPVPVSRTALSGGEPPDTTRPFPLSWSHYVFLLGIDNSEERSFYELESAAQGWSLRELRRQFDTSLYERLALSRDKDEVRALSRQGQVLTRPEDLLKSPYVLEFLGIDERARYSETDLESRIIDKLESFLLELGKGFLFEARQKRFTFGDEHFFVDLVFYNRLLRCYVLVDLKIGKLTHQDLGQMQMYVNYFDRFVRVEGEQPTVGIVLCKKKNDALVEITLPDDAAVYASEYRLYLPSKEELRSKLMDWVGEP